ncbi:hypothetical protein OF83DRAFT_1095075 [Amylostereum chailletii]|nr:hypothetical protein OF83DRAFT_1095075 [Amylostereum chailletii]
MDSAHDITKNPFASTNSLNTNPFDDPFTEQPSQQYSYPLGTSRQVELDQRERDLERRESELAQKSDHIRRHGRNNWPPCLHIHPPSSDR